MSMRVVEAISVANEHLDPGDVAAYVDGAVTPDKRAGIESHLATCAGCRAEVSEAASIIASLPRTRRRRTGTLVSVAGIAAMLLVFLLPRADRDDIGRQHRESAVTTTIPPVILAPAGTVQSANVFMWSSVPHAGGYEVRIFDPDGSVVWQAKTRRDTVLTPPPTIVLIPGRSYYWKVDALTGFERSASSDFVEFSIGAKKPQ
jgi:anti-sigma factor RsiW